MNHLNYFHPYQSKEGWHEDQLTRAYLVLLRYSHHAFSSFYDYAFSRAQLQEGEKRMATNEWMQDGWQADTQRGNPAIETEWLLSVLITDTDIDTSNITIKRSDREARYDGVITFGNKLTMILEVKPRSGNVWSGQLNPSNAGLNEETKLYTKPVVLLWKEIINQLNQLFSLPSLGGGEQMMIDDFLSFINTYFSYLNPFDRYDLCKGNGELIQRRTENLLKSIVSDESLVKYHYGWGWYIESPYPHIKKIGLIYDRNEKGWWIELCLYYGDSQKQAQHFYRSNPSTEHLSKEEWEIRPNFHVQYITTNLVWFSSDDEDLYLNFWKKNVEEIYQVPRKDVPEYIEWLVKEKVIRISDAATKHLQTKFYDTAMPSLNICPGFGLEFNIDGSTADELDKKGELGKLILNKIKEGLKVIGKDGSEFLKQI